MNNHGYPQQRPTVMTNIFPLSEDQNNVYIRVNSFLISLEVTGNDRGRVNDGPQRQSTFFLCRKLSPLFLGGR